jgi:chloramphenicol O-acetyltransferase type A
MLLQSHWTLHFHYYLHKTLKRLMLPNLSNTNFGDQIFVCEQINASATISRSDGSFGFSLINPWFWNFYCKCLSRNRKNTNYNRLFTRLLRDDNVIHFRLFPGSISLPCHMPEAILFPIVVLKSLLEKWKLMKTEKRTIMSIHVHHGLVDGLHLGQFVDYFQEIMNQ